MGTGRVGSGVGVVEVCCVEVCCGCLGLVGLGGLGGVVGDCGMSSSAINVRLARCKSPSQKTLRGLVLAKW